MSGSQSPEEKRKILKRGLSGVSADSNGDSSKPSLLHALKSFIDN
jgi:hypothetical protein